MSVINNTHQQTSGQFQILQPESGQYQSSDEIFVSLDDWKIDQKSPCLPDENMTVGIVIDEETFIVLDQKQSFHSQFNSNDWSEFIAKKKKQIIARLPMEGKEGEIKSRIGLKERNAILSVSSKDIHTRKLIWEIANYSELIEQDFILKQKADEASRHQILTILSYDLTECEIKNLKQNVIKIHKVVKIIGEHRHSNADAHRLWTNQKQIMQWIYDSLIRYAIEDQQVKYCKGIEYICLGIVISYPVYDLAKYSQIFHHFLTLRGFRELYCEGSPRFFRQLQTICHTLKEDAPRTYEKIYECEGDLKNLFVTYFRSCLIYRVTNPEIIRKIFELLFVEGMQSIKVIILRIIELSADRFLTKPNFLENMSSQIVVSYFQGLKEQKIKQKLQNLFTI